MPMRIKESGKANSCDGPTNKNEIPVNRLDKIIVNRLSTRSGTN